MRADEVNLANDSVSANVVPVMNSDNSCALNCLLSVGFGRAQQKVGEEIDGGRGAGVVTVELAALRLCRTMTMP